MKTLRNLKAKLESVGASLDEYDFFFCCDAPNGYAWFANSHTSLKYDFANTGGQTWLVQAVREAENDLKMGLYKVTDENELAEIRHNNDDDTWGAPAGAPDKIEWPK